MENEETTSDFYNNFWFTRHTSFNGERIATIRSLISVYERRIERFKEEARILTELTESQYQIVDKLGISPNNMILSPIPVDHFHEEEDFESPTFYSPIEANDFISSMKDPKCDFRRLFESFPFIASSFFDPKPQKNLLKVYEYVQTLNQEKRIEFYDEIFFCLNNLPFYLSTFFTLLEVDSFQMLSESVESILPKSLNYQHAVLYTYDSTNSTLTIEKQKVKMRHIIADGVISEAIKQNKSIFINKNDPNLKDNDISIMVKKNNAFFIPIREISLVLALFDKIGPFTPFDDLIANSISTIILEIGHVLQLKKRTKEKVSSFQGMSDIFLQLSSVNETKNFLYVLSKSITKTFNCQYVKLFKVSQSSNSFWMLSSGSKKTTSFQIGYGIIGYSIAKKSSISLPHPENSVLFQIESDRPDSNTKVSSILVCPIFDDNNQVKWTIVLYNKLTTDVFSPEDTFCLEILSRHFHPLILSVVQTNKLSDEMKVSSRAMDDYAQLVDFLSYLPNLNHLSTIGPQVTRKMKSMLTINKTDIYTIDYKSRSIIGNTEEEIYINNLDPESEDPIVRFSVLNQLKEQKASTSFMTHIYCPLIGTKYNVVGMMVLSAGDQSNGIGQSRSSLLFQSTISMASSLSLLSGHQSALQKKLAVMNQKPGSSFYSVSNAHAKKVFSLWSKIVGDLIDVATENIKIRQSILLEERINDSLLVFDQKLLTNLYPQIQLNFIGENKKEIKETEPIICVNASDDLIKNQFVLISLLNQFPGDCKLLTIAKKVKKGKPTSNLEENINIDLLNKQFQFTNQFDPFSIDENSIIYCLINAMKYLDVAQYFNFTFPEMISIIQFIRKLHKPKLFTNWRLSIDHIQFLCYFLDKANLIGKLTPCQKASMFFYLLLKDCDPIDVDEKIKIRYYLEYGSEINVVTSVFMTLSSIPNSSFFNLPSEEQNNFLNTVESIEQIKEIECSVGSELYILIVLICSFSYLARSPEISQRWLDFRFDEECNGEKPQLFEDMIRYQLEFEMRVIIQPAFSEFAKQDFKVDAIRRNFTESVLKIAGINC
ncbi:hypothetical protein TRFO_39035 [Tritrichomonas foetus]|uniref:GAF domain-containing protein n=1 Tax=Tritrichomonas foetus TaxID=1144522 RepID=A0A1J4JAW5_9EUKA|nr:hypothetical protein TRFO_39035 [Tritrichomonas foetus]|eukprot:OHS94795.1 hypothetical protein TRFO_39035 [Tritrichomonas foetus]